jgi:PAS domain S-box-containing protein
VPVRHNQRQGIRNAVCIVSRNHGTHFVVLTDDGEWSSYPMDLPTLNAQTVLALRSEAIESDSTGVAIMSAAGDEYHFLDVNRAFEDITGYAAQDVLGRSYEILAGPRTSPESLEAIATALNQNHNMTTTVVSYRADGTPLWVQVSVSPRSVDHGAREYVLLTIRDATAFVRARVGQELVRDASACIRQTPHPSDTLADIARMVVPAVADWCAIHTLNIDGSLSLRALMHPASTVPVSAARVDVRGEGIGAVAASSIPLRHQPSDPHNPVLGSQMSQILGTPVHAVLTVPIAPDATHTFGAMTWVTTDDKREFADEDVDIAEDIAVRIGYHYETYRVRANLSTAVRARETFLSVAGHELRTPVVSIKGYAQLLLRDFQRQVLSPRRLETGLRTIESAAEKLRSLTEDLFTVYSRGSATMPLNLDMVELDVYLRDFFKTAETHLLHGHTLDISGITPTGWVNIDSIRFAQVLYNLMNNAERFSPPSDPIRVATARHAHGVVISVTDTGKGLDAGEETSIFEPFVTSPRNADHTEAGLGISLYISHQIVQRHDGRIWAESAGRDQGTTFRIFLPSAPDPAS